MRVVGVYRALGEQGRDGVPDEGRARVGDEGREERRGGFSVSVSSAASAAAAAAAAVGVADRFAAFGRAWPFYLAFGLVAASPSLVLPFWEVRETFFLLF